MTDETSGKVEEGKTEAERTEAGGERTEAERTEAGGERTEAERTEAGGERTEAERTEAGGERTEAERTEEETIKDWGKRPEGILVVRGNQEVADKLAAEGAIETRLFIESHGNDKNHVAQGLKNTILNDLRNEKNVAVREVKFHPVVVENNLYAGFTECDLVVRDFRTLLFLTTRYGPSAVEILSPDSVKLTLPDMQAILADVSGVIQSLSTQVLGLMADEKRKKIFKEGLGI